MLRQRQQLHDTQQQPYYAAQHLVLLLSTPTSILSLPLWCSALSCRQGLVTLPPLCFPDFVLRKQGKGLTGQQVGLLQGQQWGCVFNEAGDHRRAVRYCTPCTHTWAWLGAPGTNPCIRYLPRAVKVDGSIQFHFSPLTAEVDVKLKAMPS